MGSLRLSIWTQCLRLHFMLFLVWSCVVFRLDEPVDYFGPQLCTNSGRGYTSWSLSARCASKLVFRWAFTVISHELIPYSGRPQVDGATRPILEPQRGYPSESSVRSTTKNGTHKDLRLVVPGLSLHPPAGTLGRPNVH